MGHRGEDCVHFLKGQCSWGDSCNFRHVEAARAATTTCPAWLARNCFADHCPLLHPKPAEKMHQGQRGSFGSAHPTHAPEGQPLCKYQFQGGCKRMATCTFYHLPPGAMMGNDRPHGPLGMLPMGGPMPPMEGPMAPMGGPMPPHSNSNGYPPFGPRPGFMPRPDFHPHDAPFNPNNNFNNFKGPRGDGFGPRPAGPFGPYDGFGPQGGCTSVPMSAPMRPMGRNIYVRPDFAGPVPVPSQPPLPPVQQQPPMHHQHQEQELQKPTVSEVTQQVAITPSPKPVSPTTVTAHGRTSTPSRSPTPSVESTEQEEEETRQPRFVVVLDGDEDSAPTPQPKTSRNRKGPRRSSAGIAARSVKEVLANSPPKAHINPPSKKKTPSPPAPQPPTRFTGRLGAATTTTTPAPKHSTKQPTHVTPTVASKPPAPKPAPAKTQPAKVTPAKGAASNIKRPSPPRDSLEGVKVKTLAELLAEKRAQQQTSPPQQLAPAPAPVKVHTETNISAATKRSAETKDELAVKRTCTEENKTPTVGEEETPFVSDELEYGDEDAYDLTEEDMAMFEGEGKGEGVKAAEEVLEWQAHLDYILSL